MKEDSIPETIYFNFYGQFGQHISKVHFTEEDAVEAAERNEGVLFVYAVAVPFLRKKDE